ncbi:5,10-methylenetetrahydrofolate reductase [Kocuria tytonicola]|uniref:methylenetetrahydrofolate reductase n=1 Tax=Kocuria tytonicola TaxID=2055946 RepID=UPI000EF93F43|nr:methylenetetrahydrofolate reductase [Kocuria tytonicola]RLZ03013.1 5,10-methylenetetrahydrofolate reductase [Kocuria tytonicola]
MPAPLAAARTAPVHPVEPPTGTSWLVRRPRRSTLVSFEVFPPRPTADPDTVWRSIDAMAQAGPDFFSVTHGHSGAPGVTREALRHLRRTTNTPVMAHFTCGGTDRAGLESAVEQLLDDGVRDLLALRGDPPLGGAEWVTPPGGLNRASDLVRLVRDAERRRFGDGFRPGTRPLSVSVACYPSPARGRDFEADLASLWDKQEAGADYAITQVLYEPEDYARFLERARSEGIHIPVVAGLMPLTDPRRLRRMTEITGVSVPRRLTDFLAADSPEDMRHRGIAATLSLIDDLLDLGCAGFHLYTFNRPEAALTILEHLRVRDAAREYRGRSPAV